MAVRFEVTGIGIGQAAGGGEAAAPCIDRHKAGGQVDIEIAFIAVEQHDTGKRRRRRRSNCRHGGASRGLDAHAGRRTFERNAGIADRPGGAVHIEKPLSVDMFLIAGDGFVGGVQKDRCQLVAVEVRPVLAQNGDAADTTGAAMLVPVIVA